MIDGGTESINNIVRLDDEELYSYFVIARRLLSSCQSVSSNVFVVRHLLNSFGPKIIFGSVVHIVAIHPSSSSLKLFGSGSWEEINVLRFVNGCCDCEDLQRAVYGSQAVNCNPKHRLSYLIIYIIYVDELTGVYLNNICVYQLTYSS